MTLFLSDPTSGAERREWHEMGHTAYRSGESVSLAQMPEPAYGTVEHPDGVKMAWMMGYMDAFMQDVRGSVRVQDDFNQVVNESLVHPLHRVEYGITAEARAASPVLDRLLQDAERACRERSPPPADELEAALLEMTDDNDRPLSGHVTDVTISHTQAAARAYAVSYQPPADEPEVVNPGTRKRRMIEV